MTPNERIEHIRKCLRRMKPTMGFELAAAEEIEKELVELVWIIATSDNLGRALAANEKALATFVRKHHPGLALIFRHLQHEHTEYAATRREMLLASEITPLDTAQAEMTSSSLNGGTCG